MLGTKRKFSEQKTERFWVSMPSDVLELLQDEARRVCLTVPQLVVTEAVRAIRERRKQEGLQDMINKQKDIVNQQAELAPGLFDMVNKTQAMVNVMAQTEANPQASAKAAKGAKKTKVKRSLTKGAKK